MLLHSVTLLVSINKVLMVFVLRPPVSLKVKKLTAWTFDFLSPNDQINCDKYKDYPPIKSESSLIQNCEDVVVNQLPALYRYPDDGLRQFIMFDKRKTRRVTTEFKSEDSYKKLTKEDILFMASKAY